jgi:pimeloyl-ACP methyl ester carboxylesterase
VETVTHHGRETAYRLAGGEGAHAVCVHGSGGTHRVWAAQYAPDGPVRPAAAVDLSGHGDSEDVDADPGPDALDAYAADVVAVARETGARTLVGTSLGGAVVLRVALDAAFDPAALVLAGTGAKLAVTERLREWLAVVGEHDGLTPPSYHEYLAANVREEEYREIPGAAHAVMIERPDAFNGAVGRFL